MDAVLSFLLAAGLGAAGGGLVWATWTLGWLRWIMLTPLAAMLYVSPPAPAVLGGLGFGIVAGLPAILGRYPFNRRMERAIQISSGVLWAAVAGLSAWLWPDGQPAWGLAAVPGAVLVASVLPVATNGRTATILLQTVQGSLPVAHIARLGSPHVIPVVLAVSASVPVVVVAGLIDGSTMDALAAGAAVVCVVSAILYGRLSYRRARRRADEALPVRVAAVSSDLTTPAEVALPGQEQRDRFDEVVRTYEPLVRQAAQQGARLVVMPETVAFVHGDQRARWVQTLRDWALANTTTIVAGLFDQDQTRNRLLVVDPAGDVVAEYDKRHPLRGGEPAHPSGQPPAMVDGPVPLSALICYDLDFSDYQRAVAAQSGVLVAPSNDWREYADLHDGLAVWAPVMTGMPLVRCTGHGRSTVFDAAGRRLATASSFDGTVLLVADLPA